MPILIISFIAIMLLTFGVIAFIMRPSPEQKALDHRITVIKSSPGGGASLGNDMALLKATQESTFGWLEELLQSYQFSQRMQLRIIQANSTTTPGTILVCCVGLFIGSSLLTCIFIPVLPVAIVVGFIIGYMPLALLSFRRNRRVTAFNNVLADTIDIMGRALRAGHSMVAAIGIVAEQASEPARFEFGEVFKQQNYGLPLRDALMQLLDRVPSQDLRVLVTGILVQKDTGGNLAEILDRIVSVIRERLRIQGDIRVHTAQGRLTGWILCALPLVMGVLINIINPGYSKILFEDPFGRKLLYVGGCLLCIGGFLIRQIINGIEV
jgi:tight adherence protein B